MGVSIPALHALHVVETQLPKSSTTPLIQVEQVVLIPEDSKHVEVILTVGNPEPAAPLRQSIMRVEPPFIKERSLLVHSDIQIQITKRGM